MNRNSLSLLLIAALSLSGAAAACGGTPPVEPVVPSNSASASAPTASTPATTPTPSASTPTPTASTPTPTPSGSAPPAIAMKDPIASAMSGDLQKIGLDLKNLPPMAKMAKNEKKKLRQVMDLFVKATGLKCTDCHDGDDYDKPTPRKNIATHMWDEWARGMTMADGSPIFCDSCHQGRTKILDRTDKKALGKWMQAKFVDGLARKDKKDNSCATCHGADMDMDFLDTWKKK